MNFENDIPRPSRQPDPGSTAATPAASKPSVDSRQARTSSPSSIARCPSWQAGPRRLLPHLPGALFFISLLWVWSFRLLAQDTPGGSQQSSQNPAAAGAMFSSYEGQNVSSIELAGQPDLDPSAFASAYDQQVNHPFSQESIEQAAATIKAAGKFEDVRVEVDPASDGLRVTLILEPAMYFGIFQFPGVPFAYSRLLQVANYPVQSPFNPAAVERDRKRLINFYRQQGYFEAEVRVEVKVDKNHQVANVSFPAVLGRRAKFGNIVISGVPPPDQEQLRHSLTTLMARARTVAIRDGKTYRRGALNRAVTYLQSQLQKKGLLGAKVTLAGAEYHADTNRADIHFDVVPGPSVGVDIQGAHLWSWTRKTLLPMYQGVDVDDESVEEGRQALASYFQSKGYFDAKVEAHLENTPQHDTILYRISKQKKFKVAEVKVAGNAELPSSELTPQIVVEKKHFLSTGKLSDQLVRKSVANLEAVYASEGFSEVKVVPAVTNNGNETSVLFRVTEGPRDMVHSLTVEGADTFPASQYAPGGLRLAAGKPYSQAHVQQDRTNIVANYLKAGYLISSFRETATEVSKSDRHQINVVYHISEGPRVITGDIVTLGRTLTRQRLIDADISAAGIKPEQPLTATQLLTAGSNLYEHTGIFDWAEVDPKREVTTQTTEDVLVKVHEAKKNEFTYGIGFEVVRRGGTVPGGTVAIPGLPPIGLPPTFTTSEATFWGPRGSILYTRTNVHGKGESISVTGFAGRLDQRFGFYYIDPAFRWSHWRATTSFTFEHNAQNPIFTSAQEIAGLQFQRYIDRERKDIFFLRYQFSQTNLTHVLIPDLVPPEDQNVQLSTIAANLTRDTRDNVLDEHKGVLQSIELDLNTTKLGSSVNFAKMTGQAAFYKEKFHNIVWANSIRIGLAQPFADSRVPTSELFFTGGGNSLRGFPLDSAGPQRLVEVCPDGTTGCNDFIKVPAGGQQLLILNTEARIPMPFKKGLSLVPFYDGGNVFSQVGFRDFTRLYSNTVGLGLRYATPIGPIRVDVGRNLNPVQGLNPTQYFISVGQAF
jgi:outer membrane protein insertion porin family